MSGAVRRGRVPAPVLSLCIGLCSGWAVAAAAPHPDEAPPQPTPVRITKVPETCAEQCELIAQLCIQPCDNPKLKPSKKACEANCDAIVTACDGSCREKGLIDGQYMRDHVKMPRMPPGKKEE